MPGGRRAWLLRALLAGTVMVTAARGEDADAIRREYAQTWSRLVSLDVQPGDKIKAVAASDDLRRAWQLIGEFAAAFLREHPRATSAEVRAALGSLDPEDPAATCKHEGAEPEEDFPIFCELARFGIQVDVVPLEPAARPVFGLAVGMSYFGRLLVVTPDGVSASEEIIRRGRIGRLADTAAGGKRFYVRGDWGDWPTSNCGSGELSVWQWDGHELHRLARRSYGYPRDPPRFNRVFRHGRWLKLYGRGARSLFSSCSATEPTQLWKIRVDPETIRDFGPRFVRIELGTTDRLVDRVLHRRDVREIASPAVIERLTSWLAGAAHSVSWDGYRVDSGPEAATVTVYNGGKDRPDLVFTVVRRSGRPFVADVRRASASDLPYRVGSP
jgi:hypothetical protein